MPKVPTRKRKCALHLINMELIEFASILAKPGANNVVNKAGGSSTNMKTRKIEKADKTRSTVVKDSDTSLYLSPSSKNMANVRSNNVESIPTRRIMPDRKAKHVKAIEIPQSPSLSILMRKSSIPTPVRNSPVRRVTTGIQSSATVQSPLARIKHTKQSSKIKQQQQSISSDSKSKNETKNIQSVMSEPSIISPIPIKAKASKKVKTDRKISEQQQTSNNSGVFNSSIPIAKSVAKSATVSAKKTEKVLGKIPEEVQQPVKKTRSRNNKLLESRLAADLLLKKTTETVLKKARHAKKIGESVDDAPHEPREVEEKMKANSNSAIPTESQSKIGTRTSSRNKNKTENRATRLRATKNSSSASEKRIKTVRAKKSEKVETEKISTKPIKSHKNQPSNSNLVENETVESAPEAVPVASDSSKSRKKRKIVIELEKSKPSATQSIPEQVEAPVQQEHLVSSAPSRPKVIHTPIEQFKHRNPSGFTTPKVRTTLDFNYESPPEESDETERRHSKVWHSPIMNLSNPMDKSNDQSESHEKSPEAVEEPVKCPSSPPIQSSYAKALAEKAKDYKYWNNNKPLPAAKYQVSPNEDIFAPSTSTSSQTYRQNNRMISRRRLESSLNDSNAENEEPKNYKKSVFDKKKNVIKKVRTPLKSIPVTTIHDEGEPSGHDDMILDTTSPITNESKTDDKRFNGNLSKVHTSTPVPPSKRKQLLLSADIEKTVS